MIDKLRDEIIESQKARTDLMKWKLILVAAIGAAGFGIGSHVPQGSHPPLAPARDDFGWTVLKWAGGIGAAAGLLFDYLYRYQRRSLDRS